MKRLLAACVVLAPLAFAAIRPGPVAPNRAADTVRVRVFELVDAEGRVRSRINVEENGEVLLRLYDQQGAIRVKLGGGQDGSGLVLLNDATEPGVHLLSSAAGSSVRVANKDGRERLLTP